MTYNNYINNNYCCLIVRYKTDILKNFVLANNTRVTVNDRGDAHTCVTIIIIILKNV